MDKDDKFWRICAILALLFLFSIAWDLSTIANTHIF